MELSKAKENETPFISECNLKIGLLLNCFTLFYSVERGGWLVVYCWFSAEAVNNMCGLGFNGYDDNGKAKWDRVTNINILKVEVILYSVFLFPQVIFTLILYLIIISWVPVGYELAIIISYPTSASGVIILLKTPKELQSFSSPNVVVYAYTYHICGQQYMSSYAIAC